MKVIINDFKISLPLSLIFIVLNKYASFNLDYKSKKKIVAELKRFAKNNKGYEFITIESKDDIVKIKL